MNATTWHEPFAGSAPAALRLLSGRLRPLCDYAGTNAPLARQLLAVAGMVAGSRPRVVLSDAGPWGAAWSRLSRSSGSALRVARAVGGWWTPAGYDPRDLRAMVTAPPLPDPDGAVAQFLWMQAHSPRGLPAWWDGRAWVVGQVGGPWCCRPLSDERALELVSRNAARGVATTLFERLRMLAAELDGAEFRGRHATAHRAFPAGNLDGWVSYLDPPRPDQPTYEVGCTPNLVLDLAQSLSGKGARVLVSGSTELPIEGWHSVQLGPREWLTCSFVPLWRPPEQLGLFPGIPATQPPGGVSRTRPQPGMFTDTSSRQLAAVKLVESTPCP